MKPFENEDGEDDLQDAAKLGQVRREKGPSWHLEAILEPSWLKMAKMAFKMRLESAKMRFWRRLGGLWGGLGALGGGTGGVLGRSWAVKSSVQGPA